jgi:hypothetical protein
MANTSRKSVALLIFAVIALAVVVSVALGEVAFYWDEKNSLAYQSDCTPAWRCASVGVSCTYVGIQSLPLRFEWTLMPWSCWILQGDQYRQELWLLDRRML